MIVYGTPGPTRRTVLATPHLKKSEVSIIDMTTWKTIKRIPTEGPGFFKRSHENTPYAWVDVFFGPNRDKVYIIDKRSLEIVETLQPEPGKTAAHVVFDRDGRHALLSIRDNDAAVIVYDAQTLDEYYPAIGQCLDSQYGSPPRYVE